ncbi:MAG: L,D-transpeptidase family protein [Parvularcula sp.]
MRPNLSPLHLTVRGSPNHSDGQLQLGPQEWAVKLGRNGVLASGQAPAEGDGATPTGTFGLRQVYFRPDRVARPHTGLPVYPLTPDLLWCDDPTHPLYNRPVRAPFPARVEPMWMERRSYDVCIVLDFNLVHPRPGKGSAIFVHLTRCDLAPPATEGCIALPPQLMHELLPKMGIGSTLTISEI